MRFERTGKVAPLTPRWRRFILEDLAGRELDDLQSPEELRADYACLSGLLAFELKTLEEDGSERMENLTDELRQRPDWPVFFGSAPVQSITKHVGNPETVRLQFINRIGRAIINHLKKANRQLGAHSVNFPRKNLLRVMLLVNEDHEIYEPAIVGYVVRHALHRCKGDAALYPNVDAVIYTSERHATVVNQQLSYPVLSIEGPDLETAIWKRGVINEILQRWARWNGVTYYATEMDDKTFSTIDHIPERMPQHELWRLEYRRNPYMQEIDNEALRDRFDEAQIVPLLMGLKSAPIKPSKKSVEKAIRLSTHVLTEMNERGIAAPEFDLIPSRLAAAAIRLRMPKVAVEWFANFSKN